MLVGSGKGAAVAEDGGFGKQTAVGGSIGFNTGVSAGMATGSHTLTATDVGRGAQANGGPSATKGWGTTSTGMRMDANAVAGAGAVTLAGAGAGANAAAEAPETPSSATASPQASPQSPWEKTAQSLDPQKLADVIARSLGTTMRVDSFTAAASSRSPGVALGARPAGPVMCCAGSRAASLLASMNVMLRVSASHCTASGLYHV